MRYLGLLERNGGKERRAQKGSALPPERIAKISYRKQCQTKNGTPEIEIMTNAIRHSPIHPRKQIKHLGDMSQDDYHQTSCAD
jgi:hypothetical protein